MDKFYVHRINFFEPEAKAIHSLACDIHSNYLAVLRSNSLIEVWNLKHNPYLEKIIPGEPPNSIECIGWHKGRLFSGGLHGKIVEYDLLCLTPKRSTMVPVGGGIWCMSINKSLLAVGTENGYVSIYELFSDLDFKKTLNKQEGRIMSIAWHESGLNLVTGSIDTIRIFDAQSGMITDRIIVGRSEKKVDTIIWCLAVTKDMTIISGDSCGRTSFWDGKTATLISSSTSHKADVLTLCLSEDENVVYSSGVDPVIVSHARSTLSYQKQKWMKSVTRNIHTHDVRALELFGDYLISGGVDTNLVFSKFPPKTVISFPPFSEATYCCASKNSYILLKYPQHIELWKLGSTSAELGSDGERLPLNSNPIHIAKIKCKSDEIIVSFALSQDAQWITYSTAYTMRLFQVTFEEDSITGPPIIQRVKMLRCKKNCFVRCLSFMTKEEKTFLLSLTNDGELKIVLCNLSCPEFIATFSREDLRLESTVHLMTLSSDSHYIGLGTQNGEVSVISLLTNDIHCTLPRYNCQPTAMEFDTSCKNLIVAYSDRKVVEFDIEKKAYSTWSSKQDFTDFQKNSFYPIKGISCLSTNKDTVLFYDEGAIYKFDKSIKAGSSTKRKKLSNGKLECSSYNDSEQSYKIINKYRHLLEFKVISEDKVLVIEVKPTQIQSSLPPALQRKKYGT